MIFPVICPICQSDSGRRIISTSPEVETFRCGACRAEWSEPAVAPASAPGAPSVIEAWRRRIESALTR